VEELLDAGRQLSIMLCHVCHGRSLDDSQILWLSVDVDLPCGLPRALPLALCWTETPADRARSRFELALVAPGCPAPLGTLTYVAHTLSRQAYERKRLVATHAART